MPGQPSWFRRDAAKGGDGSPTDRTPRSSTFVAKGVTVSGTVSGAGSVQVEGRIEGRVELEGELIVAVGGEVDGPVDATSVRISGLVRGAVRGRERVELAATGRVEGDITSKRVAVAEGAMLAGEVAMLVEPSVQPGKP